MKFSVLSTLCVSLLAASSAQAVISVAGDLMFTGYNSDGNDDIAFVLLNSYPANTTIFFTDNEWNGTAWNDNNETFFHWSSPVNLAEGTVITVNFIGAGTLSSSTGSAVFDENTGRGLGASNEGLYAYVGSSYNTATPTFISAIANSGFANVSTGLLTGTGLTAGSTASVFTNGHDIYAYAGDRTSQAGWGAYAGLTGTASNWISEDGAGDQSANSITPDMPFDTTAFTVTPAVPEPGASLLFALCGMAGLSLRRRKA